MGESRRGPLLTTIAILFAILALTDILKPLKLEGPTTGLVFFGIRQTGIANTILGPLMGLILLFYAAGIWRLRRYAMMLGWLYAAYVIVNMPLFILKYHGTAVMQEHSWAYLVPYPFVAIGVSSGAAWLLYRRKADLA